MTSPKTRRGKGPRRERKGRVLDAYRVDVSRALSRVLGLAATLVLLGSMATGSALVMARVEGVPITLGRRTDVGVASQHRVGTAPSATSIGLGALGLLLVLGGAGAAMVGLRRVLREERYLLLRSDGALFVQGRRRRLVKWQDVEDVHHEGRELVFVCHDGLSLTIEERYGGVTLPELARRAASLRRKALFGLLR